MNDFAPVYFDFSEFGLREPVRLTVLECSTLLRGCESLIEEFDDRSVHDVMEKVSIRLLARACAGNIDEEWLTNAAMIVCVRGLMGHNIHKHIMHDL